MNTHSTQRDQAATSQAPWPRCRRGFSMVELLVALTISGTLMAAMMVALDVMFKRYTVIADNASTNVVARVVMHRILAMIRTGTEFGPYPADVLDRTQNPADYTRIQFVSHMDTAAGIREVTTVETRSPQRVTVAGVSTDQRGPNVLWLVIERTENGVTTRNERPLLDGVVAARFNLDYDVGPRLRRATVDLTIAPQGNAISEYDQQRNMWSNSEVDQLTGQSTERHMMSTESTTGAIRMVASTSPRTQW